MILWLGTKDSILWSPLGMFSNKIKQQKVYVMFEYAKEKNMGEYLLGVVILGK